MGDLKDPNWVRYFSNLRERPSDLGEPRPAWPQTWDIWLKQKVTKYVSQPGSRFQLDCNHSFPADSCGAKHKVVLSLCSVVKCGVVTSHRRFCRTCPLHNPSCQTFSPEHRMKLGTGQLFWQFSSIEKERFWKTLLGATLALFPNESPVCGVVELTRRIIGECFCRNYPRGFSTQSVDTQNFWFYFA